MESSLTLMCLEQRRQREERDFDCRSCGACCGVPQHLAGEPIRRRYLRSGSGHVDWVYGMCMALEGKIGQACHCEVYDDRPAGCRELHVGSVWCQGARRLWGVIEEGDRSET